ncbi:acetyltransferase [Stenotrophomonas sp. SAU14A_NAIMI4_8]|uniref:acetyltransferase n=1 Tax=Stenotrophomonas sp. SAU14A_NAIMI4_8 TaxID=2072409 RepID=UPI000D53DDD9|nr:acetyltransferase [Stenotrophomonas sp. SAU14A_NAIMI4_8]AWH33935.1 acetyltransferase [Stenotrophomonas sp. SAU14A_NAIMI4_8]
MWWNDVQNIGNTLLGLRSDIAPSASVAPTATIVGEVEIADGARICHGAYILGPVKIGKDTVIGNNSLIRGPAVLGNDCQIGFSSEVKNAIIESDCKIGPQCFIADSVVCRGSYLGAMVRTSNHRLDGKRVSVMVGDELVDTGMEKLGAKIGNHASLGVQVVTLPGREVAPRTILGPRITVQRNLPPGRYQLTQRIESY